MKSDPRVCKIPMTEFNHLSLAEVDEWKRLVRGRQWFTAKNGPRIHALTKLRVFPDRGHNKGDAA